MANGLSQMSVEFWLNVPVGQSIGNSTYGPADLDARLPARRQFELWRTPRRASLL